jgi:hypothetical protein
MGWLRRAATVLAGAGLLAGLGLPAAAATTTAPTGSSSGIHLSDVCSADYFDSDARLGPAELPDLGAVGFELAGYRRTGGEAVNTFIGRFYNATAGSWIYPPDNGYLLAPGGQPIEFQLTLIPGQSIDRFGSEFGSFLAPAGLPYAQRSIPPQSLDSTPAAACNYHDYRVLLPFRVDAGPIAPWFAQPGGGLQYQLDSSLLPGAPTPLNVMWLVNNGYLARVN